MWHWPVVTFVSLAEWTTQTFRETTSGLQRFGGCAVNTTLFIPDHLQPGFGNDDYANIIYWTNADYCEHFQIDCGPRLKHVTHVTVNILDDFDIPITKAAKLPSSTSFSDSALLSRYPFHPRPTTVPAPSLSLNILSVTTTLTQDAFPGSKPPHPSPATRPTLDSLPRCTSSVVKSEDVTTKFSQPGSKEKQFFPPPFLVFSTTTLAITVTATASLLFCFLSTIFWLYRYARAADAATAESLNRANEAEMENGRLRDTLELAVQEKEEATKRADTAEKERDALLLQLAEKQDTALQQSARANAADRQRRGIQFRAVLDFRAFKVASMCLSWLNVQRINNDADISRLLFQQRVDQSDINIKKTALESKQIRIDELEAASKSQEASKKPDAETLAEIAELEDQLQSKDHTITETGAMVTRLQKIVDDKDAKIKQHQNTINEQTADIKQHKDTIKSQGKVIAANTLKKSEVDAQTALASKLQNEAKENEKTITDQNVTINSQGNTISQLRAELKATSETVQTQESKIKDKDVSINDLQDQLRTTKTTSRTWQDAHARLVVESNAKDKKIETQTASMVEKDERVVELESSNKSKDDSLSQHKNTHVLLMARDSTIKRQQGENEGLQQGKQEAEKRLQAKAVELDQANRTIEDMRQAVLSTTTKTKACTQGTQTEEASPAESTTPPSIPRFAQSAQDADEAGLFIQEDARVIFSIPPRPQSRGYASPVDAVEQTAWSTTPIAVLRSTAVPPTKNDVAVVLSVDFRRVQRNIRHLKFCRTLGGKNDGQSLATILSKVSHPYLFAMPAIEASEAAAIPLGTDAQCLRPFESLQLSRTMGFTVLPNEGTSCKKKRAQKDANKAKGRKDGASSISTSLVSSPSLSHASLASSKPKHDLFKSKWAS